MPARMNSCYLMRKDHQSISAASSCVPTQVNPGPSEHPTTVAIWVMLTNAKNFTFFFMLFLRGNDKQTQFDMKGTRRWQGLVPLWIILVTLFRRSFELTPT